MCLTVLPAWLWTGSSACASIRSMPSATTFTLRMLRARLSRCCRRRGCATAPTTSPAGRPRASALWPDGRRDCAPRASRHPAGPHPQGRHVGCLRYFATQRRDRLEAAADARSTACLHGLDGGRARLQPVTGTKMNPSEPYPRDLVGYGARAPHPHWPGEARIAVSLVLNCEEEIGRAHV